MIAQHQRLSRSRVVDVPNLSNRISPHSKHSLTRIPQVLLTCTFGCTRGSYQAGTCTARTAHLRTVAGAAESRRRAAPGSRRCSGKRPGRGAPRGGHFRCSWGGGVERRLQEEALYIDWSSDKQQEGRSEDTRRWRVFLRPLRECFQRPRPAAYEIHPLSSAFPPSTTIDEYSGSFHILKGHRPFAQKR
jgi:hypothetical protein